MFFGLRKFWTSLLSRCMFCRKFMLYSSCLVNMKTAEGTFMRPCCYKCFIDYMKALEETKREESRSENDRDESL